MEKIKVLLVDDHKLVRQGLRKIIEECEEMVVVGEAENGQEAVALTEAVLPDVVIMDIVMPVLNGLEATRQITRRVPKTKILILSMYGDELYVRQTLKAGARGYLLKSDSEVDLLNAIRAAQREDAFFSPTISKILRQSLVQSLHENGVDDWRDLLTSREIQILQLLAEGQTNKQIAERLCLSINTVDTHRRNTMRKLDLHNIAELVLFAVRKGLVQ